MTWSLCLCRLGPRPLRGLCASIPRPLMIASSLHTSGSAHHTPVKVPPHARMPACASQPSPGLDTSARHPTRGGEGAPRPARMRVPVWLSPLGKWLTTGPTRSNWNHDRDRPRARGGRARPTGYGGGEGGAWRLGEGEKRWEGAAVCNHGSKGFDLGPEVLTVSVGGRTPGLQECQASVGQIACLNRSNERSDAA